MPPQQNSANNSVDLQLLESKLQILSHFPNINTEVVEYIRHYLQHSNDWEKFRINPLDLAKDTALSADQIIDAFIYGTKAGIFDFSWNMVCNYCGGIAYSHQDVNQVQEEEFYCAICYLNIKSELDEQVEVVFRANPGIAHSNLNPYLDANSYLRYFFSPHSNIQFAINQYLTANIHGFVPLEGDSSATISFTAEAGAIYRILCLENHTSCKLEVSDDLGLNSSVVENNIVNHRFSTEVLKIKAGKIDLKLNNMDKTKVGALLFKTNLPYFISLARSAKEMLNPIFSAKMLLNTQSFRDTFRTQTLNPSLKLHLRSLTILFTDLKGSTELYDRTGDAYAYQLIQDHFDELTQSVRKYQGAIIKTMGDAVMASFSEPTNAVKAALEMMSRISELNNKILSTGHTVGLKIGIHEGNALAVNLDDRLDYFGQTINIGTRVQNLAQAGEIWTTEKVNLIPGVIQLFEEQGYHSQSHEVSLKGIGQATRVLEWSK